MPLTSDLRSPTPFLLALASFYHKGWPDFYKKRDFVRKSLGCLDLWLVIFCILPILGPPADVFHAGGAEVAEKCNLMVLSAISAPSACLCVSDFFVLHRPIVRETQRVCVRRMRDFTAAGTESTARPFGRNQELSRKRR